MFFSKTSAAIVALVAGSTARADLIEISCLKGVFLSLRSFSANRSTPSSLKNDPDTHGRGEMIAAFLFDSLAWDPLGVGIAHLALGRRDYTMI